MIKLLKHKNNDYCYDDHLYTIRISKKSFKIPGLEY